MPTISVNVPEKMREKIDELAEENMYSNTSEYIRAALRKQINEDTGLTPEEEEIVIERLRQDEEGESNYLSIEEAKDQLGL
ncbi:ribbon-helix-helix domain-containing protein [Candidatus Nanohalobium constans]|uniref:CopG family transcriptional regulator n=1 Tax=Candidatus Nanohalobium constans TaxID=2565781 RepID=A0A5Q0UH32_9ARCH|nr:ribbon-helix-helix domain-containing protein [Candidatus Nanohalobium constans]QGA80938.1 CopG family transcriptional regulator [Candidatus Nanohalobium constans]